MKIEINGLEIGYQTIYKLQSPVEGFDTPPIRTSQQNYSGDDGGVVTGQFYGPRLITLTGFMFFGTCAEHEEARRAMQAALPIRTELPVTITTFSGAQYITTVRVLGLQMPITDPKRTVYKIDLIAEDPNFYSNILQTVVIPLSEGGGFILPVVLPAIFGGGTSPTVVTNSGAVAVEPVFEITGESTNPVITNVDTGEFVGFNLTLGPSDVLRIDMAARTATLNGSSVLSYRDPDSSWMSLLVGANRFIYETDDALNTGVATVQWRNAVISI